MPITLYELFTAVAPKSPTLWTALHIMEILSGIATQEVYCLLPSRIQLQGSFQDPDTLTCNCLPATENEIFEKEKALLFPDTDSQDTLFCKTALLYFLIHPNDFSTALQEPETFHADIKKTSSGTRQFSYEHLEHYCPAVYELLRDGFSKSDKLTTPGWQNRIKEAKQEIIDFQSEATQRPGLLARIARLPQALAKFKRPGAPIAGLILFLCITATVLAFASAPALIQLRWFGDTNYFNFFFECRDNSDTLEKDIPLTVLYSRNPELDRDKLADALAYIDKFHPAVVVLDYHLFQPCADDASHKLFHTIATASSTIIIPNYLETSHILANNTNFKPNTLLCHYLLEPEQAIAPAPGELSDEDLASCRRKMSAFVTVPNDRNGKVSGYNLIVFPGNRNSPVPSLALAAVQSYHNTRKEYFNVAELVQNIPSITDYGDEDGDGRVIRVIPEFWKFGSEQTADFPIQIDTIEFTTINSIIHATKGNRLRYPSDSTLKEMIEGRIVLVGLMDVSHKTFDMHTILTNNKTPGLKLHANVIANLLGGGRFLTAPEHSLWTPAAILMFAVLSVLMMGAHLLCRRFYSNIWWSIVLQLVLLAVGLAALSVCPLFMRSMYENHGLLFPLGSLSVFFIIFQFLFTCAEEWLISNRENQVLRRRNAVLSSLSRVRENTTLMNIGGTDKDDFVKAYDALHKAAKNTKIQKIDASASIEEFRTYFKSFFTHNSIIEITRVHLLHNQGFSIEYKLVSHRPHSTGVFTWHEELEQGQLYIALTRKRCLEKLFRLRPAVFREFVQCPNACNLFS